MRSGGGLMRSGGRLMGEFYSRNMCTLFVSCYIFPIIYVWVQTLWVAEGWHSADW